MTKITKERNDFYERVLRNTWGRKANEYTVVSFIDLEDVMDIIHQYIDIKIRNNIGIWMAYGLFNNSPISRINLDYANYIQLDKLHIKHHDEFSHVLQIYVARKNTIYMMATNKNTINELIATIRNEANEDFQASTMLVAVSV